MSKKKKEKNLETALQVYVNDAFGKIRAMLIDGKPYFVGKDVAGALGYKDVKHAVLNHVDVEDRINSKTGGQNIPELGQRGGWLINESGLYSLILSSKLDSAKAFKRWVTSEVLPSIRETGTYTVDKNYQRYLETHAAYLISRHSETDTIKLFIEYARAQGCTWEESYIYAKITIWCNVGAGLPKKGGRGGATIQQLNTIDLLEGTVVKNVLINGMTEGLHWTQILARVEQQINAFLQITFQTPKLLK